MDWKYNEIRGAYSIEALYLGRKREISSHDSDPIAIIPDVVISEEHDDEVTITRHPVDTGAPIADHAYKNPAILSVRFAWSDSSSLLNTLASGSTLRGISGTNEVYKTLLELMNRRSLLTVSTGKRLYQSMVITKLSTTSTAETETALICDITFEEVILVSTRTTTLDAVNAQYKKRISSVTGGGGQRQAEWADEIEVARQLGL